MSEDGRAQLVVLAAVVVALATLPILTAVLQLGYVGDRRAAVDRAGPSPDGEIARSLERALDRALENESNGTSAGDWENESVAAATIRERLAPAVAGLRTSRQATVVSVRVDAAAARRIASGDCPSGPRRTFGPCEAIDGVVLQHRPDRLHVVGVAIALRLVSPDRRQDATLFVRPPAEGNAAGRRATAGAPAANAATVPDGHPGVATRERRTAERSKNGRLRPSAAR